MRYPIDEDVAGRFRTRDKTGDAAEALMAEDAIVRLANAVLTRQAQEEAETLAEMLVGTKSQRNRARRDLMRRVRPPPKRPMYYCQHEVQFLPRWTRNALRYLGDFIDLMVKHATFELEQRSAVFQQPLGPAIDAFARRFPQESILVSWLRDYNRFLYRGAKHDMNLPAERKDHRFTSREVVLCLFITMELAGLIAALSPAAAEYRMDL